MLESQPPLWGFGRICNLEPITAPPLSWGSSSEAWYIPFPLRSSLFQATHSAQQSLRRFGYGSLPLSHPKVPSPQSGTVCADFSNRHVTRNDMPATSRSLPSPPLSFPGSEESCSTTSEPFLCTRNMMAAGLLCEITRLWCQLESSVLFWPFPKGHHVVFCTWLAKPDVRRQCGTRDKIVGFYLESLGLQPILTLLWNDPGWATQFPWALISPSIKWSF